jgi:hypothetical protein
MLAAVFIGFSGSWRVSSGVPVRADRHHTRHGDQASATPAHMGTNRTRNGRYIAWATRSPRSAELAELSPPSVRVCFGNECCF